MKLYYFDIYGRAESIRFLAAHAKLELTNEIINGEKLGEMKAAGLLEFGQVPMLEVDGKHLVQSWAILRYLGRQHGYYPQDAEVAWRIDSTIDACEDYLNNYFKFQFEKDEEKKKALWDNFTKFLPNWLTAIEKRLLANESQNYLVGSKATIADFALALIGFNCLLNEANPSYAETLPFIEKHETLKAYATHWKGELGDYLAARPQPRPF
jgi:glutathione S-transferase